MTSVTVTAIGPLVRDVVFLKGEGPDETFLLGSRGGGALWNALVNASLNKAATQALCIGGSDTAAAQCVDDLRTARVSIALHRTQRGKPTRTLHELLSKKSVGLNKPSHEFTVVCPVCGTKTYLNGTARVSEEFVEEASRILRRNGNDGLWVHLDGLDSTRLDALRGLPEGRTWLSLDLGRSTGLFRMRQTSVLERLARFDVLFVHSKVVAELKRMAGAGSESDLLSRGRCRLLVVSKGAKGLDYWARVGSTVIRSHQDSSHPERLLDTAGAGDALIGSFLAQLARSGCQGIEESLGDKEWIEAKLRAAQDWAAYKCGFIGARGHLAGTDGKTWSWDFSPSSLKGSGTASELRLANLSRSRCVACDWTIDATFRDSLGAAVRFKQNLGNLPVKVEKAWKLRGDFPWPQLRSVRGQGYVVGTGGSFVVATFLAQLLTAATGELVAPIRPFDYVRTGIPKGFAVFVSNTGRTHDIAQALDHALSEEVPRIFFVTGAPKERLSLPLRASKDTLLSTGADGERGFLSVAGAVVPCFFASAAFTPSLWENPEGNLLFNRLYNNARKRAGTAYGEFQAIRSAPKISNHPVAILGGGLAWPAMLDLESKMVEGGLGLPQVSEMKDYSHGRFVSSMGKRGTAVVCGMPDDASYRSFLITKLRARLPTIELSTEISGSWGALDLVLQVEHLLQMISEREGVDISSPEVPAVGLELYHYKSLLQSEGPKTLDMEAGAQELAKQTPWPTE